MAEVGGEMYDLFECLYAILRVGARRILYFGLSQNQESLR